MSKKDLASELPSTGSVGVQPAPVVDEKSVEFGRALAQFLYTVRYKTVRGVIEAQVAASTFEKAQKVAEQWVNSQPGRALLTVRPTVVADETILLTPKQVVVEHELSRQ